MNGYSEIYIKIDNKKAPFKKNQTDWFVSQVFDKEKITIKKKGKTLNQYDFTQARAGENDFYKNLEKYNGDANQTIEALNKQHQKLSDDLIAIKSIDDVQEYTKRTKEAWEMLPLKVRKEFNFDLNKFRNGGEKWVNNKIEEYNKAMAEQKKLIEEMNKQQNTTKTEA